MTEPTPPLRRLLRDRAAEPQAPGPAAHADAMLRAHVLGRMGRAFAAERLDVLLVKGAALALTVYATPAARAMGDVDLLVRRADRDRVLAVLAREGFTRHGQRDRPLSEDLLGETILTARSGAMTTVVEVHTTLDKVVARPIDERALFARALPAPGAPGLLVPSREDHALLVALHAAGHEFRHPVALLDLELLLRRGLDLAELARRARAWRLSTVMYVAMATLREAGAASVTDAHVRAFEPARLRRAIVGRCYDPRALADPIGGNHLGARWILLQAPLRDDLGPWLRGVARYAALRGRERVAALAPPARGVQDARVTYRVPLWVRAFLAADRFAMRLENAREGLRDELLLSWIPPNERGHLTAALYAQESTYLPGGHRFRSGLFGWERRAIDSAVFPRTGRVLLGAAGGGRELVGLVERGFEVLAFDPCEPFVEGARRAAGASRATVILASYDDLIDAAAGRGGPLACVNDAAFDAVVLGWGSFSHVAPRARREALLAAVRSVAPRAPVLLSFALDGDSAMTTPGRGRVRTSLGRLFSALHAPATAEAGDHFYPNAGFLTSLTTDELTSTAWTAGYEVALFEDSPYPHALLVPLGTRVDAAAPPRRDE